MDKQAAEKQIDQMIAFIHQEAREKIDEIRAKTEADYTSEKLTLIEDASLAVREEFNRRRQDRAIAKRIERSKLLTNARYQSMRRRDDKMRQLKEEVTSKLEEVAKSAQYKELLQFLIVQGLLAVQEEVVAIQVRKEDEDLVKGLLAGIPDAFQAVCHAATGIKPPLRVSIHPEHLPVAPSQAAGGPSCAGGVNLIASKGKIICRNTLDSRLEHALYDLEPQIRGLLFGVRPAPVVKAEEKGHGHH